MWNCVGRTPLRIFAQVDKLHSHRLLSAMCPWTMPRHVLMRLYFPQAFTICWTWYSRWPNFTLRTNRIAPKMTEILVLLTRCANIHYHSWNVFPVVFFSTLTDEAGVSSFTVHRKGAFSLFSDRWFVFIWSKNHDNYLQCNGVAY